MENIRIKKTDVNLLDSFGQTQLGADQSIYISELYYLLLSIEGLQKLSIFCYKYIVYIFLIVTKLITNFDNFLQVSSKVPFLPMRISRTVCCS